MKEETAVTVREVPLQEEQLSDEVALNAEGKTPRIVLLTELATLVADHARIDKDKLLATQPKQQDRTRPARSASKATDGDTLSNAYVPVVTDVRAAKSLEMLSELVKTQLTSMELIGSSARRRRVIAPLRAGAKRVST
ncbi:hypothetical protein F442_17702 [Phytophthora nicotianae P10297]|nr:hypothetical protein L916_17263 [Phytophthora nicotianae]ETL82818.1 hypothetical protein L917_17096 [Phytophthora nicotianae]ETM36055.1 hypothetical protein L914_17166 [Phytophthora nicotianae]ETP33805.1 hypothetical protein F442_17702 [Phytophthora nicotianae P10297]